MIDYPLFPLANQGFNLARFGYKSLSLSMKGSASVFSLTMNGCILGHTMLWAGFVSLTDGLGLLNSFQRIVTASLWQCWRLPEHSGVWLPAQTAVEEGGGGALFKHTDLCLYNSNHQHQTMLQSKGGLEQSTQSSVVQIPTTSFSTILVWKPAISF